MQDRLHTNSIISIREINITEKKLKYRGEGNANLVLALPQERVILRLHKCVLDAPFTPEMEKEEEERVRREAVFCSTVMVPLLGTAYIQPPIPGFISSSDIQLLHEELLNQRPLNRHHKMVKCGYANIYPDYALLPAHLYCYLFNSAFDLPVNTVNRNTNKIIDSNLSSNDVLCSKHNKTCIHRLDINNFSSESGSNNTEELSQISTQKLKNEEKNIYNLTHPMPFNIYSNSVPPLIETMCYYAHSNNSCLTLANIFPKLSEMPATFCVEIKPKQGWIPPVDRHYPKCTFCLNQYLKLSNNTVKVNSEYCPLELFSGYPQRMKKSIEALLNTPQNNLKIFKDGLLIYSDDSSSGIISILQEWLEPASNITKVDTKRLIDKFTCLVVNALMTDLSRDKFYPIVEEPSIPHFSSDNCDRLPSIDLSEMTPQCNWDSRPLPDNCILDRILKIQKLQQTGSEYVYSMYKTLVQTESNYDYVKRLQDPVTKHLSLDNVQRYLLATTAKDCSILISFQCIDLLKLLGPLPYGRNITHDLDGATYLWNIGVSDLDPKPLSCIEKHCKRDYDIIKACCNYLKYRACML